MIRHDFEDIMFTVAAEPSEYSVSYTIYRIGGWWDAAGPRRYIYERADSQYGEVDAEDLADADVFASGFVKWDGCSNWSFDGSEAVMIHGCSRKDLTNIGEVLARCWDMTAELCPKWDELVAGRKR